MRHVLNRLTWVLAVMLSVHVPRANADVIIDNTAQTPAGNSQIGGGQFDAQEFSTGSQSYSLTSILAQVGGSTSTYTGFANLVADNGGTPAGGTVLTTFTVPTIGSTFANETFTPNTSGVILAANTNYWFVLGYSSGTGQFGWNYAGISTATGPGSLGHYATSFDNGSTWIIDNFGPGTPNIIQVNGTIPAPVPEPSTWAMLSIGFAGLGFARYRRATTASAAIT